MEPQEPKPWYQKAQYIVPIGLAALVIGFSGVGNTSATNSALVAPQAAEQAASATLSNDSHYTNSSGNEVHSPAYSNDNTVPDGASALCRDGSYSFSQHRSGTCSHHGGVATWY